MAVNEKSKPDIEIDDGNIDKTEKKLRSLDKLLQQTQRRASLLGKTRIKPILALDDRFSFAASRIGNTLTRLDRTTAKPIVQLDDRASAAAFRLHGILGSLAVKPWRLPGVGLDWNALVADSFTVWMETEGKSKLRRISASLSSALSDGLKVYVKSIPVWTPGSKMEYPNRKSDSSNKIRMPGFKEDGSYYSVEDFLSSIYAKKTQHKPRGKHHSSSGSRGSFGSAEPKKLTPLSFLQQVGNEYLKDRFKEYSNGQISQWSGRFAEFWKEKWPNLRSRVELQIGTNMIEGLTKWGAKAGKLVGKAKPFVNKIGGVAGVLLDGIEIASAKTSREKYEKVTSAVLSTVIGGSLATGLGSLFTAVGPEGTVAGAALGGAIGGAIGGYVGDPLGGFIYDLFHGKIKPKPQVYSDRIMAPSVQGVTLPDPNANVPKVMGTPVPNYYQLPEEVRSKIGRTSYNQPPSPVNVSMSKGAINLTVNKEELDYQKLAETAGWKIANEVRFAMQNLK